jgi:selenocysteine lyase/cysteine desulfurase
MIAAGLEDQSGQRVKEAEMTQWEYKIINIRSENYRLDPAAAKELNHLGDDGWELVSITSVNFKTGATDNIAMVFKRPRS